MRRLNVNTVSASIIWPSKERLVGLVSKTIEEAVLSWARAKER
jgi:hypothetical protein